MRQIIFLFFFLFHFNTAAQTPAHYIRSYGTTGSDAGIGVCHDLNGNVYATGYFSGNMMVDSTHYLNSSGGSDIYILKNDASGNLLWAVKAGGTGLDRPMDITCDAAGNIFVTGFFSGSAQFGNQTITSSGLQDFFIAKYDAAGNFNWVQKGGGSFQDEGKKLDVDASGFCVVTGTFSGTATFGSTSLTSMINTTTGLPSIDIFIALYSPTGSLLWVKKGSSQFTDRGTGITFDNIGSIYITGQFSDTISFTSSYPNVMYNSCFMMKLDYNGNEIWFRKISGGNFNFTEDVGVNTNGKVISTGYFKGTPFIDFTPPLSIQAGHEYGVFIIQWNANGTVDWIQTFGSECYVDSRSISFDDSSNIYLGGNFKCKLDDFSAVYGEGAFNSVGFQDVYIAKFNPAGTLSWARNFGGQLEDFLSDLSVNIFYEPLITGKFENRLMFPVLHDQSFNLLTYGTFGLPSAYGYGGNCNELQQWKMFQVASKGQTDAFIAKPCHQSIGPYYYYFNYGDVNCTRPFVEVEISGSQGNDCSLEIDSVESCFNVELVANSNTSRIIDFNYQNSSSPGPRFTYLWSTGATTRKIQPQQSGTYWVKMTSLDSCFSSFDTIVYTKHPLPPKPKMSDSQGVNSMADSTITLSLCKPDSLVITIHTNPSYDLIWNTTPVVYDSTSITISNLNNYLTTFSGSNLHMYLCRVYDENGCMNGNSIKVIIDSALATIQPQIMLYHPKTGDPLYSDTIRVCDNLSAEILPIIYNTLSGVPQGHTVPCYSSTHFIPDATFSWSLNPAPSWSSTSSCYQAHYFDIDSTGWYTINCTMIRESPCGAQVDTFIMQKSVYVILDPVPSVQAVITGNNLLCPGDSLLLTGSGGQNYSWYFDFSSIPFSTQPLVYVSDIGEYKLTVSDTNQFGCYRSSSTYFDIYGPTLPNLTVTPNNAVLCPGDSVAITCTSSGNYTWYGPTGIIGTNSPIVYVSQTGIYYCEFDSAGCSSTSLEVTVTGYATPVLTASPSEVLCPGEDITLDIFVSNSSVVQWLPPLSGSALQQTVSQPGTYICEVVACAITTIDSVVIIPSTVSATIQPAGTINICAGDEVTLTANPGMAFYFWQPEQHFSPVLFTGNAGSYSVMTTDVYGCNAFSDSVVINMLPTPSASIISSNNPLCSGETLLITASYDSLLSFQWTLPNGNQISDSGIIITSANTSASGIYVANLSNGICTSTDSINIIVDTLLYSGITTTGTGCVGESFQMETNYNNATTYQWNTPYNTIQSGTELYIQSLQINNEGWYSLDVIKGACLLRDSVYITPEICGNVPTNVFTPNGDGFNDSYIFQELPANGSVLVMNRWGKKVFETNNSQIFWNGNFMNSGQPCPEGVYYFIIKNAESGNQVHKQGVIHLFR